VAHEQRSAEPRLELTHVMADRTGGEVQLLAGAGEVLVAGRGLEGDQRDQQGRLQGHSSPKHTWCLQRIRRACWIARRADNGGFPGAVE
jgi:hypothetical protein